MHIPPRVGLRVVIVAAVTALLVAPLSVYAGHRFLDVPDADVFHSDIEWLADARITRGCNPPANDQFCPDDSVSRGQMAAFMRRFAQYLDAEDGTPAEADHAASAGDADTLDGLDASAFLLRSESSEPMGITAASDWKQGFQNFGDPPVTLATITLEAQEDATLLIQFVVEVGSLLGQGRAWVEPGTSDCSFGTERVGEEADIGTAHKSYVRFFLVDVPAGTLSYQLCGLISASGFTVQADDVGMMALLFPSLPAGE